MALFIKDYLAGSVTFFLCAAFYCVFWGVSYNGRCDFPMALKSTFFTLTALFGVAAIAFFAAAVRNSVYKISSINNLFIVAAAVITYIILALITKNIFNRVVTTELILIVFCTMGALCVLNSAYQCAIFGGALFIAFLIITGLVFIVSLICYVIYYKVDAARAFLLGFVPLVLYALISAALFFAIILRK